MHTSDHESGLVAKQVALHGRQGSKNPTRVRTHPQSYWLRATVLTLIFAAAIWTAFPATFTVSNVSNAGTGSLRNAMVDANANPGLDIIEFKIDGSGSHRISPLAPLPSLVDPVVIDGTTQPGYIDLPLIEIDGSDAQANFGFRLLAGNSMIRGLAINRFRQDGIRIEGPGTNVVQANHIGSDPSGTLQRGNSQEGVIINNSWGNLIGGTNLGEGNLISCNGDAGVYLLNGGANRVQGNRIGTSITGADILGNGNNGVAVYSSTGNIVGGEPPNSRNLISGNRGSGVYIFGGASKGNSIQGNLIGTDLAGTLSLSNVGDGITIFDASGNIIGGPVSAQGNLLSGNGMAGLYLNGAGASNNVVQGNLCGTDLSGTAPLGNALAGIVVLQASGNLIGSTDPAAGNTISANRESGVLLSTNSCENQILGNRIGVDISGTKPLGNNLNGISVQAASLNLISTNVISGNMVYGCEISQGSSGNRLERNLIGTDLTGQVAIGNSNSGVRISSAFNTVGGIDSAAGNLVSGNLRHGVFLAGSNAQSNTVQGNLIGLDGSGSRSLKNGAAGVVISDAPNNLIGTSARGNCISGNGDAGVYLYGPAAVGNRVAGNRLGTDVSGTASVANHFEGIYSSGANSNIFGGLRETEGNLISGNRTRGIFLTNSSWNFIQGNVIGMTADGQLPLPNRFFGIELELDANNNTIGGSCETANLIAFTPAPYAGVRIRDGSVKNSVLCNSISRNGGLAIDLGQYGIDLPDPCDSDSGANLQQNPPSLGFITAENGVAIRGTLSSRANTDYVIQFYANPSCSPSGQGQIYLGQHPVHTDQECRADFAVTLPFVVPIGHFVTATATDPSNNTSEFSPCQVVAPTPSLSISATADSQLLQVSWPFFAQGFILKSTGCLTPPVNWQPVADPPVLTNGQFEFTAPLGTTNVFYRLSLE